MTIFFAGLGLLATGLVAVNKAQDPVSAIVGLLTVGIGAVVTVIGAVLHRAGL